MSNIGDNPVIKRWLATVAFTHTKNDNTKPNYTSQIGHFFTNTKTTPEGILADYEIMDDKKFKRKYTPIVLSYAIEIQEKEYSPGSIQTAITVIKSFFKYNDLPLGHIPVGRRYTMFHNRDIQREEIEEIIKVAEPRERAFYALMVQSGLRPNEICKLRIKSFEKLLDVEPPIPCLITILQSETKGCYKGYFTFSGKESIYYLKEYLKRKPQPKPDDYLFTQEDDKTPIDTDLVSHTFRRTVTKLKKQNILDFDKKVGKQATRNELRLYNLRKYFSNQARPAGKEFVNFWMGHSNGVDDHYFSGEQNKENIEKHRKLYEKVAMPNLRLESKTPNQQEELIENISKENRELKERLAKIEKLLFKEQPEEIPPEVQEEMDKQVDEFEEFLKNRPPEELEREERAIKKHQEEYDKYLDEHPEIVKQMDEQYQREIEDRLARLENVIMELAEELKKSKKTNT